MEHSLWLSTFLSGCEIIQWLIITQDNFYSTITGPCYKGAVNDAGLSTGRSEFKSAPGQMFILRFHLHQGIPNGNFIFLANSCIMNALSVGRSGREGEDWSPLRLRLHVKMKSQMLHIHGCLLRDCWSSSTTLRSYS